MKALFCIFLSIFAFSSMALAADDDEFGYDPEVDAAFRSLQITTFCVHKNKKSLSKSDLSNDQGTLTARTTDSEASMRTTERKPEKKRSYDEMSSDSDV